MQTVFLKVHKEASSRLQKISYHLSPVVRIYECCEHVM